MFKGETAFLLKKEPDTVKSLQIKCFTLWEVKSIQTSKKGYK